MDGHDQDYADVDLFIRLDRIGAVLGLGLVIVVNIILLRIAGIWIVVPFLLLLIGALTVARAALGQGRLFRALALVAAGNWAIAVAVPILLPFLWPVMALTVLMPLVLAGPHLSRKQIMPGIVVGALVLSSVASIGLLNDDGGVIDDIDDSIELVLVVGSLLAQLVPIGLVVWQHNELQRANLADLTALNTELTHSETELEASRDRVVQAADTERRRIERDLHDGAQQRLVALGVRLRLLQSQGHDDPVVRDGIDTLIEELDAAIGEVRELAHGIYPPLLQTRGLPDALAAVVRRTPLDVDTDINEVDRYDQAIESALYFTALEALANAAKHAPEAVVQLQLGQTDRELVLTVTDGGPGFDPKTTTQSHGFNNMRDRLAVVGGRVEIDTAVGSGTTVRASVPTSVDLATNGA